MTTTNIFDVDKKFLSLNTTCINIINDTCGICRNKLIDKCIECQTNIKKCQSVLGTCGHGFHKCCINKWTKIRNICPLDDKNWQVKEFNI